MNIEKLLHDKAFISGKWTAAGSGKTFEVANPATGEVILLFPTWTGKICVAPLTPPMLPGRPTAT